MILPQTVLAAQGELDELEQSAAEADWGLCRDYAPKRRREFLSWRRVVRHVLGADVEIAYDEVGAPYLRNDPHIKIGVSHAQGRVAVVFSERRCAVDIEQLDRDFGRVASHYTSEAERRLSADPRWLAVVWSAKETLYKFSGRTGLDLIHDLRIEGEDLAHGRIFGRIEQGELLMIEVAFHEDLVLTSLL